MVGDKVIWARRGWQPVSIGYCPSEKAWKKAMKRSGHDVAWPDSDGCCVNFQAQNACAPYSLIAIRQHGRTPIEMVGLLAHEVSHAIDFVFSAIQEDCPGDEVRAYAIQSVLMDILSAYEDCHGVRLRFGKPKK